MLKIGDKAVYKPNWENHIHDGRIITIKGYNKALSSYIFSIDDFPECNGREYKNTWQCSYSEAEPIDLNKIYSLWRYDGENNVLDFDYSSCDEDVRKDFCLYAGVSGMITQEAMLDLELSYKPITDAEVRRLMHDIQ